MPKVVLCQGIISWMLAEKEDIAARIEEALHRQTRELVDAEHAVQILRNARQISESPERADPIPAHNGRSTILANPGYIARDSVDAANRVESAIFAACASLARHPNSEPKELIYSPSCSFWTVTRYPISLWSTALTPNRCRW